MAPACPFGVHVDTSFKPTDVVGLDGTEFPRIVGLPQDLGVIGRGKFGTVC